MRPEPEDLYGLRGKLAEEGLGQAPDAAKAAEYYEQCKVFINAMCTSSRVTWRKLLAGYLYVARRG